MRNTRLKALAGAAAAVAGVALAVGFAAGPTVALAGDIQWRIAASAPAGDIQWGADDIQWGADDIQW
ncbi:hypothetical protein OIE69_44215 (plasmid) [Actinacidiphila glaucinigra]|uniref:hypothetical protein n=1 Tax=Actinacidiphila glaucinigra TaxID=235986 RepID=UPI002DD966BA|nr:hypothetical protein [Actinacidiphila glaucinigra]WSD65910.1 hypothetical protein OIE69_44215 [Actinacidiphila glaucinigra]